MTKEFILNELAITEDVIAIFPYGSRVYGTNTETSDHDFIIVTKGSMLKSGAFRQNAISNKDRTIQGVLYSRSGFIDAINNYEIGALECLFLPKDKVILCNYPFKIQKWYEKDLVSKIIEKASASWYVASNQSKDENYEAAKKGIYHALRILYFGIQLKETTSITNYQQCNALYKQIMDDVDFDDRNYIDFRDNLISTLKNIQ